MSELLIATNKWLEVCDNIKNKKLLIEKYPGDASLRIDLQLLEKKELELKAKKDRLKSVTEKIQQGREDMQEGK